MCVLHTSVSSSPRPNVSSQENEATTLYGSFNNRNQNVLSCRVKSVMHDDFLALNCYFLRVSAFIECGIPLGASEVNIFLSFISW